MRWGRGNEGGWRDYSAGRDGAVRDGGLCADRNGDSCGLKTMASGPFLHDVAQLAAKELIASLTHFPIYPRIGSTLPRRVYANYRGSAG